MKRRLISVQMVSLLTALTICFVSLTSCDHPAEAPRVKLSVVVDDSELSPFTTDLGYEVELSDVRVVMKDLSFTVAGETHTASLWRSIVEYSIPSALAHPGHEQGGEVTGELLGDFTVSWPSDAGRELGVATLIAGSYSALDFTFSSGSATQLSADDPLIGHTIALSGVAKRDAQETSFTMVFDAPEDRALIGAPFDVVISSKTESAIGLHFTAVNPRESGTIFDAVDFADLDRDSDGVVTISPETIETEETYEMIRQEVFTHTYYSARLKD